MSVLFLRRLMLLVPTLAGVTLVAFLLVRLIPGDPVQAMLGERIADPGMHAQMMHDLGLDRPLVVQYGQYLVRLLQGDLGRSLVSHEPVLAEFSTLFPATLELTIVAMTFAVLLGGTLGVVAATRRGTLIDHGAMGIALTSYSMPIYWLGLLLIMTFSVKLRTIAPQLALPVSGRIDVEFEVPRVTGLLLIDTLLGGDWDGFRSVLMHLILPSVVLGTFPLATIARMTRSAMLEILREDFIRAARARGFSSRRVLIVHAMRNALIPIVTVIGLQVGALLGGAVLTETVFAWPGIGRWMVDAIARRDYPILQGGVLLIAILVIMINLCVDALCGALNPRIRHQG